MGFISNESFLRKAFKPTLGMLLFSIGFQLVVAGVKFEVTTSKSGINYRQFSESYDPEVEFEIWTGGAASGDFDGDGWVDLFVTRLDRRDILYRNRGATREEGEVWFEDVTLEMGIDTVDRTNGAAWGDIDNDGDLDLLISVVKSSRFYLYVNEGNRFVERAFERGVAMESSLPHQAFSVVFGDYDRDGWLDIHTCEWGIDRKHASVENHSVLFRNLGSKMPGHFVNVTHSARAVVGNPVMQFAFTSSFADMDSDGWPDLLVTGDFGSSQTFWNNGDGTFREGAKASGLKHGINEMGSAIGDMDGDGDLDWFVTSTYGDNQLYINQGNRQFVEMGKAYNVEDGGWGWGASFFDPDNDGDLDLVMTNGWHDIEYPESKASSVDPMYFWENTGLEFQYVDPVESGLKDDREGKALLTFDYDRDGDMDLFVVNNGDKPVLFTNITEDAGNWLQVKFKGAISNSRGIGARLYIQKTLGASPQLYELSGANQFLGQSEALIHAGLADFSGPIARLRIVWPSGVEQILTDVDINQRLTIREKGMSPFAKPVIQAISPSGYFEKDEPLELQVTVENEEHCLYTWYRDGEIIEDAFESVLSIRHLKPSHEGVYSVVVSNPGGQVESSSIQVNVKLTLGSKSIARLWNEALLDGIRLDYPDPPVHARNLYHLSAALWDAYWAYEPEGWSSVQPVFQQEFLTEIDWMGNREAAQQKAMSYAAYQLIKHRFSNSPGADQTLKGIDWLMNQLGYDPSITIFTGGTSPEAVGNRIATAIIEANLYDGANEINGYEDLGNYEAVNEPMVVAVPGTRMNDPNRWQPLSLSYSVTQNGLVEGASTQHFVGANAMFTRTFAIGKPTSTTVAHDPGPHPQLGGIGHDELVKDVVELIAFSSQLDPSDEIEIDVSPGAILNNDLGTNNGRGHVSNPFTGKPYEPNIVLRADFGRILAEFWADGPDSETPPGHWNVLFNEMNEHPEAHRNYLGQGDPLSRLEWDVVGYLALNGAMHDAACAAWTIKRQYDSSRPISLIRYMGGLGQSSDPNAPSYHKNGLPLIEGLIELTSETSLNTGGRHNRVQGSPSEGRSRYDQVVIRSWTGNPVDPDAEVGGVSWIFAEDWNPYQKDTFVTPAFPGYVSGHSTFSRAGAEVLTLLTGSEFFPGGMATQSFAKDEFLVFEKGPERDVTLQWATFYDAADQAGISRIYGGIHISADDLNGRIMGSKIGAEAFEKVLKLYGR